jgi:Flp pilus assembly pilin Flp
MQFINCLKKNLKALVVEENGQDGFEYLLIVGGVSVAIVGGVVLAAPDLLDQVIAGVCGEVATVMPDVTITCA